MLSSVTLGGKEVPLADLGDILSESPINDLCVEGTGLYAVANCSNHSCSVWVFTFLVLFYLIIIEAKHSSSKLWK